MREEGGCMREEGVVGQQCFTYEANKMFPSDNRQTDRQTDRERPEDKSYDNRLKLPYLGLKRRLLFTDLFWIRIRISIQIRIKNDYFGSIRIRFRNHNTDRNTNFNIRSSILAQKRPFNVHSEFKCENFTKNS